MREDSKTNILPSPAITGSGMCVGREPSKPQIPQDSRANVMPSSASTDSGMCVGGKVSKPQIPQRPATSRRLPVQTRASAGREAKKKVRQMQQPAYQLAHGEHQEAGLCLAVIEGRAHKYSAHAIYSFTRPNTSIFADMGQGLQVCQRALRRGFELNRDRCHPARDELLGVIEGRTCSYSAHAIYSSTRSRTSIISDMGQGW